MTQAIETRDEALKAHWQAQSARGCGLHDGWSLWTDGWTLIGVQRDIGLGPWKSYIKPESAMAILLREDAPPDAARVSLDRLVDFALQGRTVQDPTTCDACKGKGEVEAECTACDGEGSTECSGECDCDVDCEDCEGTGKAVDTCRECRIVEAPALPGVILGSVFNLNLLAEALRVRPVESVALALRSEGGDALRLWGDGFRYVQMSMRENAAAELPTFDLVRDAQ